jgi:hypothetical protein
MMDYSLSIKTGEQISTKYGAGIYIRSCLAHSIIFEPKYYKFHFKGKAHPTTFFKLSQNITRTVHYTKHVIARSTVQFHYQPSANLVNDFSATYETPSSIIMYTKPTTAHYPTPLIYSPNYDIYSL